MNTAPPSASRPTRYWYLAAYRRVLLRVGALLVVTFLTWLEGLAHLAVSHFWRERGYGSGLSPYHPDPAAITDVLGYPALAVPIPERFAAYAVSRMTSPYVFVPLVVGGLLAVALQWRAERRRSRQDRA